MSQTVDRADTERVETGDYDAVVVGAGFSGLYMLHRLRNEMGLSVKLIEKADDVGGAWYWNQYPGARCDSPSWVYCFSFSEEIRNEWQYGERFPEQSEIQEYQRFVADKLDLWKSIQFKTEVTSAAFDDESERWQIGTDDGTTYSAQFFIPAPGALTKSFVPDFAGLDSFAGDWYHTSNWPDDGVDLSGKRVGLIGTGSTGMQAVGKIAKQVRQLTVFQRTPNFGTPGRNRSLTDEDWEEIRENYDEIWEHAKSSNNGQPFDSKFQSFDEVSEKEALSALEEAWETNDPSVSNVFDDLRTHEETNQLCRDFIRGKIKEIVDDPETAEKLCPQGPTDHPYGAKRPPRTYHGYYETYNEDHVELVDVHSETDTGEPIERITPNGIQTTDAEYDLDIIVFATGFDAMTGAFENMDIEGRNGRQLNEKWDAGPRTYLGLASHEFPNLFMITGPQSPSVLTNMTVAIEQHVEWVSDTIEYLVQKGYSSIEPTKQAEDQWVTHNEELVKGTVFQEAESWYKGDNVPGKSSTFQVYCGGLVEYTKKLEEVEQSNYEGFNLAESVVDLEEQSATVTES
jgi:cyclohexanone monooxygenase